ncbi:hypothetical protein KJ765_02915 [Candidatus Micrarchaeota archaeon]|nr:hypothetical protein [Candidatus Micrarchaeota archaeon]
MKFNAWLLDVSVHGSEAILAIKTNEGERVEVRDAFYPYFYVILKGNAEEIAWYVSQHPHVARVTEEQKYAQVLRQEKEPVLKVEVESTRYFQRVIIDVKKVPGVAELAETRMPNYLKYCFEKRLTFFSFYEWECTENRRLKRIQNIPQTRFPSLNTAYLQGGETGVLQTPHEAILLQPEALEAMLREKNVDVLFTLNGDAFLKPFSKTHAFHGVQLKHGIHIDLQKDLGIDIYAEGEGARLTPENVLAFGTARLERIMELSQTACAKAAIVSRVSPGRLNTYLHMMAAKRKDYLIPDSKKLVERPKTLRLLKSLDKGGTIFYPEPGVYENVAKFDFSSMYPSIIVNYNISPETLHCDNASQFLIVPEALWRIRTDAQGIIPQGIQHVLEKRLLLKKMAKTEKDSRLREAYTTRQKALKNILVTCFGYLGFNNFVFSNVECKECVILFGRVILQRAKDIAESMHLKIVYGIVDSLFITGGSDAQYAAYQKRVSEEIGIELDLEGIFQRIVFPSAKDASGTANKYYGITRDGKLEARGIKWRHSDACVLVKRFQYQAMMHLLNEPWETARKNAEKLLKEYSRTRWPLPDYAVHMALRKPLQEYRANAAHVRAAKQLKEEALSIAFVHTVHGPLPLVRAKAEEIDREKYAYLLQQSLEELIRVPLAFVANVPSVALEVTPRNEGPRNAGGNKQRLYKD